MKNKKLHLLLSLVARNGTLIFTGVQQICYIDVFLFAVSGT